MVDAAKTATDFIIKSPTPTKTLSSDYIEESKEPRNNIKDGLKLKDDPIALATSSFRFEFKEPQSKRDLKHSGALSCK